MKAEKKKVCTVKELHTTSETENQEIKGKNGAIILISFKIGSFRISSSI